MAIGSVLAFLAKGRHLKDVRAANAAFDGLHEAVRDDEKFRPERFRAALSGLSATLGR